MKSYLKIINNAILCVVIIGTGGLNPCRADLSVPANVDPGAINRDLKFQSETRFIPKQEEETIDTSKLNSQDSLTNFSYRKFKLNEVRYTGNTVFKTAELEKYSTKLIGGNVSLSDLNDIVNSITALYKRKGYLTSKAIIPPQTIKDGIVQIQIIEGKIGTVTISGNKWAKTSYIQKNILKPNSLEEDKVFNINSLSNSMAEINSPKYLKGKVTLAKGKKPGETDIVLDVKDRLPLSVGLGWDNTGRELVGIQRGGLFTSLDNLTGIGDRLWFNNTVATRTYGLDTGYSIPVGSKGTKLVLGYSYSNTHLGGEYSPFNVVGKSKNFTTSIVQPVKKGKDYEINSRVALDMMNAKTTMLETESLTDYKLRVLRTGISVNKTDKKGRWIGDVIASAGMPFLNATVEDDLDLPGAKFVKLNTYLTRVQKLPKNWIGVIKANTQISNRTLLPAEQMQLGGSYTVRGYNEAAMLGDAGYLLSFEARTPLPFLPKVVETRYWKDKSIKIPLRDTIMFAVFYDQGFTCLVKPSANTGYDNFFNSIGAGVRISLGHNMTANFDLGVPIGPPKYDGQSLVRLHFNISTELL